MLKDQKDWEKVRLLAFMSANANPNRKPIKDLKKIMRLPLIDRDEEIRDANIKWLLDRQREAKAKKNADTSTL